MEKTIKDNYGDTIKIETFPQLKKWCYIDCSFGHFSYKLKQLDSLIAALQEARKEMSK